MRIRERCVRPVTALAGLMGLLVLGACGDSGGAGPPILQTVDLTLTVENFGVLDASEGQYEAWVIDTDATIRSAGTFSVAGSQATTVQLKSPVQNPTDVMITVQRPTDAVGAPSMLKVVGGAFQGGTADLDVNRYVTAGIPLENDPGTHVLFTPSDNHEVGFNSNEDSGIWLFNIRPDTGNAGDPTNPEYYLTFTPLTRGWIYEGWMVYDWGQASEVWLSYGKFEPDGGKKARFRDSSGLGPFSGQIDYEQALPLEVFFPGDDWVANPFDLPVPGDLPLPIDLNGCISTNGACEPEYEGPSRFTHVITVEPFADREEDPWLAQPSFIRPYRNPVGEGFEFENRDIVYYGDELPTGTARIGS